jgi:osmotically-inducible protein OsmY
MKTDSEIQKDVMEELKWEPLLTASEIGVAVKNRVVTLSGTVDSFYKKEEAENAAKRVSGVMAVAEDIEVKPFATAKKNDTEVARMIADTLKWDTVVQDDKIRVKVEDAWVTLEGIVDWEFQKESVKNSIKNIVGIRGISNDIIVKPSITVKDIKQKISLAFHRSATIDANKVEVDIEGSKAVLTGRVRSWSEKNDAEDAVWKAPGITAIENKLIIDSGVYAY